MYVQEELWKDCPESDCGCASGSAVFGKAATADKPENVVCYLFRTSPVRVVTVDAEPWFVAKDVCDCLDIRTDTVRVILEEDEVREINPNSIGVRGGRSPLAVSEAGLYSLILRSRKKEAKAFKRWVTHEVLPSIRKTGGYIAAKPEEPPQVIMARALQVAAATIREYESKFNAMCGELADQSARIELMAPKAELADAFIISKGNILVRDYAKHVATALRLQNWGERKMFMWLKYHGYMNLNRYPSQLAVQHGWLDVKEGSHQEGDQLVRHHTTRITPKGQAYFLTRIKEDKERGCLAAYNK